jgi:hypothetical protein
MLKLPGSPENFEAIHRALRASWSRETSVEPAWTTARASEGQCAVTALVVQDYFGGSLIRCDIDGTSHYWNHLEDGREIDLTRDQFHEFSPKEIRGAERDYVLSFESTRQRYALLRAAVQLELDQLEGK